MPLILPNDVRKMHAAALADLWRKKQEFVKNPTEALRKEIIDEESALLTLIDQEPDAQE